MCVWEMKNHFESKPGFCVLKKYQNKCFKNSETLAFPIFFEWEIAKMQPSPANNIYCNALTLSNGKENILGT